MWEEGSRDVGGNVWVFRFVFYYMLCVEVIGLIVYFVFFLRFIFFWVFGKNYLEVNMLIFYDLNIKNFKE